jgi:hypothetical protein
MATATIAGSTAYNEWDYLLQLLGVLLTVAGATAYNEWDYLLQLLGVLLAVAGATAYAVKSDRLRYVNSLHPATLLRNLLEDTCHPIITVFSMAINNTQKNFAVTYSLKLSLPGQCAGCGALKNSRV